MLQFQLVNVLQLHILCIFLISVFNFTKFMSSFPILLSAFHILGFSDNFVQETYNSAGDFMDSPMANYT